MPVIGMFPSGGTDTRDATATAASILAPSTAYGADGTKITGTMPEEGSPTYTPSPSDQAITPGHYSGGKVAAVTFDATKLLTGTTVAGTAGTMVDRHVTHDDYLSSAFPTVPTSKNTFIWYGNLGVSSPGQKMALAVPQGYFHGGSQEYVTVEAADIASNIGLTAAEMVSTANVLGIQGTALSATKATGSGTVTSTITVTGLAFTPQIIIIEGTNTNNVRYRRTYYSNTIDSGLNNSSVYSNSTGTGGESEGGWTVSSSGFTASFSGFNGGSYSWIALGGVY